MEDPTSCDLHYANDRTLTTDGHLMRLYIQQCICSISYNLSCRFSKLLSSFSDLLIVVIFTWAIPPDHKGESVSHS